MSASIKLAQDKVVNPSPAAFQSLQSIAFLTCQPVPVSNLPLEGAGSVRYFVSLFVFETVFFFLCNPGFPRTCSVDRAGIELKDPLASAFQMLS